MRANRAVHSLVMSVSLNRRIPAYFWKRRNRAKPLVTPFSVDRQRSFDRAYCPRDARDLPVIEYHRPTTLIIFNAIIPVFAHADPNVFLLRDCAKSRETDSCSKNRSRIGSLQYLISVCPVRGLSYFESSISRILTLYVVNYFHINARMPNSRTTKRFCRVY